MAMFNRISSYKPTYVRGSGSGRPIPDHVNGPTGTDSLGVPSICLRPMFEALVSGNIPTKIWPYMILYGTVPTF